MQFTDLIGLTADAAFVIGRDQRLVAVNEAAVRLAGEPAERLVGRSCSDVIAALHPGGERLCSGSNCPVYQSMVRHEPVSLGWSSWATPSGRLLPISGIALSAPRTERGHEDETTALVLVHVAGEAEGEQPALDLHLLGGTALFVHGVPHPLPRRRRVVELLAYLTVAASQGATRDELLETFWPNTPLDEAAPRFHVLAHTLRALLAEAGIDEALQRRGSVYQLDSRRIRVDALDFEARVHGILRAQATPPDTDSIDRALALYHGDLGSGERFSDWATAEQQRFRRMYHDLLYRAAQHFARLGAIDRSVECCERALRSDPLQESFQVALISYYRHQGRLADAQQQYERYRQALATEIGAPPPAAAIQALERALA